MRNLLVSLTIVLLGVGIPACGRVANEGRRRPRSLARDAYIPMNGGVIHGPYRRRQSKRDNDNDVDNLTTSQYDFDDGEVVNYGHAPTVAEDRAISAAVEHYYSAAARRDGLRACRLIVPSFARGFVEEYASSSHGKASCAAALISLFEHASGRTKAQAAAAHVIRVRVNGVKGIALLRLGTTQVREVQLEREDGVWKIDALFDTELS
jgi:hypothetical protein